MTPTQLSRRDSAHTATRALPATVSAASVGRRARRGWAGASRSAQARHDVRGELLERARLVLAREVEDELAEPQVHVGADLLHRLLGVVRDDEARVRAVLALVREPLELDRVLDARLGL